MYASLSLSILPSLSSYLFSCSQHDRADNVFDPTCVHFEEETKTIHTRKPILRMRENSLARSFSMIMISKTLDLEQMHHFPTKASIIFYYLLAFGMISSICCLFHFPGIDKISSFHQSLFNARDNPPARAAYPLSCN